MAFDAGMFPNFASRDRAGAGQPCHAPEPDRDAPSRLGTGGGAVPDRERRAGDAPDPQRGPAGEPVAFDGLFGWLHRGGGGRGVVLCGAQGFEQMSAHRAWRDMAERIAAAGCSVVRFDYPGEGDSADLDAPRLADWVASIRRAARFLREEAGATEIALVGLRLGGTLALLAAQEEPVERLVLMAPFLGGRAFRREMAMRAQTINTLADKSVLPQMPGELMVGGFRLGPAALADLDAIDLKARLAAAGRAPAKSALLLGPAEALRAGLSALGTAVTLGPLPGLAQLVGDPIFATAAHESALEIAAFLGAGAPARSEGSAAAAPAERRIAGADWVEEPVEVEAGLFGILCRPAAAAEGALGRAPAVMLLPTGKTVRSGWGRQTTDLARSLAADGYTSLRIDLHGTGDARECADGAMPLFAADNPRQIGAAIDLLLTRCGGPVVLAGNCSGAHAAFHTAFRDPRVGGALIVNLLRFDWASEQQIEEALRSTFGRASDYAALLRRGATWRRLVRGQVDVLAIARALATRGLAAARRRAAGLLRARLPGGSPKRRIRTLRRRGCELRFVYSEGDHGLETVLGLLGTSLARAGALLGAPITIIPGSDHNLSTREAQRHLGVCLRDLLRAVQEKALPQR